MKLRLCAPTVVLVLVYAATRLNVAALTVTSLADSGPGSLRDTVAASPAGDVIQFGVQGTIVLNSSIPINKVLFVQGPGPSKLTVSGNSVDRVFITGGNPVMISGMTISNGLVVGVNGPDGGLNQNGGNGADAYGGAILNNNVNDLLILSNCWFTANTVQGGQGGRGGDNTPFANFPPGNGGAGGIAYGGAVYSWTNVQIVNCTFSGNRALGGTGGAGGDDHNEPQVGGLGGVGGKGKAGAVFVEQANEPRFTNCTFSGNSTLGGTGGKGGGTFNSIAPFNGGAGGAGGDGECGAVSVGRCQIISCTIVSNSATAGAGGAGGAGAPTGPSGPPGSGYTGGLCAYNIACTVAYMGNSIVAENAASTARSNIDMYLTDYGFNYIGDQPNVPSCGNVGNTRIGTTALLLHPQLGPLAQNGGGLPTHAPLSGSPVIDWGHSLGTTADERGAPRPFGVPAAGSSGDGSDIGAFEFGSTPLGLGVVSNNVVVSWPAYYGDYRLQYATNLPASNNWSNVPDVPVVVGNQFTVTNSKAGVSKYYRLINR